MLFLGRTLFEGHSHDPQQVLQEADHTAAAVHVARDREGRRRKRVIEKGEREREKTDYKCRHDNGGKIDIKLCLSSTCTISGSNISMEVNIYYINVRIVCNPRS